MTKILCQFCKFCFKKQEDVERIGVCAEEARGGGMYVQIYYVILVSASCKSFTIDWYLNSIASSSAVVPA